MLRRAWHSARLCGRWAGSKGVITGSGFVLALSSAPSRPSMRMSPMQSAGACGKGRGERRPSSSSSRPIPYAVRTSSGTAKPWRRLSPWIARSAQPARQRSSIISALRARLATCGDATRGKLGALCGADFIETCASPRLPAEGTDPSPGAKLASARIMPSISKRSPKRS